MSKARVQHRRARARAQRGEDHEREDPGAATHRASVLRRHGFVGGHGQLLGARPHELQQLRPAALGEDGLNLVVVDVGQHRLVALNGHVHHARLAARALGDPVAHAKLLLLGAGLDVNHGAELDAIRFHLGGVVGDGRQVLETLAHLRERHAGEDLMKKPDELRPLLRSALVVGRAQKVAGLGVAVQEGQGRRVLPVADAVDQAADHLLVLRLRLRPRLGGVRDTERPEGAEGRQGEHEGQEPGARRVERIRCMRDSLGKGSGPGVLSRASTSRPPTHAKPTRFTRGGEGFVGAGSSSAARPPIRRTCTQRFLRSPEPTNGGPPDCGVSTRSSTTCSPRSRSTTRRTSAS